MGGKLRPDVQSYQYLASPIDAGMVMRALLPGWMAVTAMLVFPSCSGRPAARVDPACARGLELVDSAESEQEMQEARALFQTSCELGHGTGCFHLSLMWDRGMGGHADREYAMQLLQRSCDLGESQACSLLNSRLKMIEWEYGQDSGMSTGWP